LKDDADSASPLLAAKDHAAPSAFRPEALIREARRQKGLPEAHVPGLCVLDPDGDIVRRLRRTGEARPDPAWPCYHSTMDRFTTAGRDVGIVGCAVGAPYAVLIAEQMFALGCRLLVSITSAGQIVPAGPPPYFVIIDRALRDEGTSHHYAPAAAYAAVDPGLVAAAAEALRGTALSCHVGASWTTDAPFRETEAAIARARAEGILAVEMEAAALYTFARRRGGRILCLAHVTNTMGQNEEDFEKGEDQGAVDALALIAALAALTDSPSAPGEG